MKLRSEHDPRRLPDLEGVDSAAECPVCFSFESEPRAGAEAKTGLQLSTDNEERPRGTLWRYQAVFDPQEHGKMWFLVKIRLDPMDRLVEWLRWTEPLFPKRKSLAGVQAEIVRMYVDAWSWRPVAYETLRRGMTFERTISLEERARLAEAFDKMGTVMAGAQSRDAQGPSEEHGGGRPIDRSGAAASRSRAAVIGEVPGPGVKSR